MPSALLEHSKWLRSPLLITKMTCEVGALTVHPRSRWPASARAARGSKQDFGFVSTKIGAHKHKSVLFEIYFLGELYPVNTFIQSRDRLLDALIKDATAVSCRSLIVRFFVHRSAFTRMST